MIPLLAALALGAGDLPPPAPGTPPGDGPTLAIGSELGAAPGFLASGYTVPGGLTVDGFACLTVRGRYRAAPAGGFADHLFVEGELTPRLPVASRALAGLQAALRGGLAFDTWAIAAGLHADLVGAPAPLQLLPSLTATWHPGWWGFSFGLLDRTLGAIAHLDLDLGPLSVGFAAPFGGQVTYRPWLGPALGLEVHLFGAGFQNAFQVGGSVGLVWRPVVEPAVPAGE